MSKHMNPHDMMARYSNRFNSNNEIKKEDKENSSKTNDDGKSTKADENSKINVDNSTKNDEKSSSKIDSKSESIKSENKDETTLAKNDEIKSSSNSEQNRPILNKNEFSDKSEATNLIGKTSFKIKNNESTKEATQSSDPSNQSKISFSTNSKGFSAPKKFTHTDSSKENSSESFVLANKEKQRFNKVSPIDNKVKAKPEPLNKKEKLTFSELFSIQVPNEPESKSKLCRREIPQRKKRNLELEIKSAVDEVLEDDYDDEINDDFDDRFNLMQQYQQQQYQQQWQQIMQISYANQLQFNMQMMQMQSMELLQSNK